MFRTHTCRTDGHSYFATVLMGICSLLGDPQYEDAIEPEIAEQWKYRPYDFEVQARLHTQRHAAPPVPQSLGDASSSPSPSPMVEDFETFILERAKTAKEEAAQKKTAPRETSKRKNIQKDGQMVGWLMKELIYTSTVAAFFYLIYVVVSKTWHDSWQIKTA